MDSGRIQKDPGKDNTAAEYKKQIFKCLLFYLQEKTPCQENLP